MTTTVTLPLKLMSLANLRIHWSARHKLVKAQREAAIMVPHHDLPCVVTITRIAPRALDSDNLVSCAKGLRDGIADRLGVKDNDPRVEWRYAQRKGAPKLYAAEVTISPSATLAAILGEGE
jgi:hypothetical protein